MRFAEAVVVGGVVWAVLAGAILVWVAVTSVAGRRFPRIVDVLRWLLRSWLGRALALAAWAGAGWHVFCQRP